MNLVEHQRRHKLWRKEYQIETLAESGLLDSYRTNIIDEQGDSGLTVF